MVRLCLTGMPGIGKTTAIRRVVERLDQINCAGFYTQEKRQRGQRVGFRVITLDGREGTLATVGRTEPTVGRYSIRVAEFESLVLPALDTAAAADLYVVDEIGKMELLSARFRAKIIDLLAQPVNLLATIAKEGRGFVEQIKSRNDIELIEITRTNRDRLPEEIAQKITAELQKSVTRVRG